jgi:hypothetical protein
MYRTLVFVLAAMLFTTAAQAAKMYKWVDGNGVTHFSTRQPPRESSDKSRLQGGNLSPPRTSMESQELARIKRKNLAHPGWQGCQSSLCQLVRRIDSDCQTSFCSRAKHYSKACTSAACLTKKLAFEADMQDRVTAQNELRQPQAVNANATPAAPASQNQD